MERNECDDSGYASALDLLSFRPRAAVSWTSYGSTGVSPCLGSSFVHLFTRLRIPAQDFRAVPRRSRSAFPITIRSDNPMARAQKTGLRKPSMASGIPITL